MENIMPGPIDSHVLYFQPNHRSQRVWEDEYVGALHCRRRQAILQRLSKTIDKRIEPYLHASGFYGVYRVRFIQLDWHFITALVERWRQETHTFHMPHGECTITLQDVAIQLGLPVDGHALVIAMNQNWTDLCTRLLGVTPGGEHLKGARLNLNWLSTEFNDFAPLPLEASEEALHRYARAYILTLIGGVIMPDKSGNAIHLMYLPFLIDFTIAGQYSWGGACLAWLYRELCKASVIDSADISGALVLLQLWAWDRFPTLAPRRVKNIDLAWGPLGVRWNGAKCTTETSTHVLVQYRYMLDRLNMDEIVWEPYQDVMSILPPYCLSGQAVWTTRCPLFCVFVVEWHYPDRVMRQFGLRQNVPLACNTDRRLHAFDLRGRQGHDWILELQSELALWGARMETLLQGERIEDGYDVDDHYISWYNRITRRFVTQVGAAFHYVSESYHRLVIEDDMEQRRIIGETSMACMETISKMYRIRHEHGEIPTQTYNRGRNPPPHPPSPVHEDYDAGHFHQDHDTPSPSVTPYTPVCMIPTPTSSQHFDPGSSSTSFAPGSSSHYEPDEPLLHEGDATNIGEPSHVIGRGDSGHVYRRQQPPRNRQRPRCGTGGRH